MGRPASDQNSRDRQPLLLVHDEQAVAKLFSMVVEGQDVPYETATTLREARRILAATEPRAIICDLHLPDGFGWDLLSEARRTFGEGLPLALVTADYLAEAQARSRTADLNALVHVGPLRIPTLVRIVQSLLDSPPHR